MPVKPIPDGYHTLTPSLTVRDAARAIEFYKQAFGATERGVMKGPDGKIMHAELMIGDSIIMLTDEFPEFGASRRSRIGGSAMGLHIYLDGVDAAFDRAVKAGARGRNARHGPVLGRPLRQAERSLRPQMVDRHAHQRPVDGRNETRHGRSHGEDAEDRVGGAWCILSEAKDLCIRPLHRSFLAYTINTPAGSANRADYSPSARSRSHRQVR